MAFRAVLLAVAATALFLVPAAGAHTAVYSADNKVRGSVGLLNEPASTYAVTGLDVCFTENTVASPRPAIAVGNAGLFTAKLRAPNGDVHEAALEVPFGRTNCLTFADPLVLTLPGQYYVDLTGAINGTTFDVKDVKAGGEVLDRALLAFPDDTVPDGKVLQERIAALEARVAAMEADNAAAKAAAADDGKFAPGAPAALVMAGLAAVVAVLRRRQA